MHQNDSHVTNAITNHSKSTTRTTYKITVSKRYTCDQCYYKTTAKAQLEQHTKTKNKKNSIKDRK